MEEQLKPISLNHNRIDSSLSQTLTSPNITSHGASKGEQVSDFSLHQKTNLNDQLKSQGRKTNKNFNNISLSNEEFSSTKHILDLPQQLKSTILNSSSSNSSLGQ
jgi:hypothetical protein